MENYIDPTVIIEKDVTIYPPNTILGKSYIKSGTIIYPNNLIVDSTIGSNCKIYSSTISNSTVGNFVSIGPNAHLRQNTVLANNIRVGNFVEIKNSTILDNTKIAHLTYVGDAYVGKSCNLGCGVVFCNYDGKTKHKTTLGNNVFVGSNVNLIAPIHIQDNCFIAAGSTITKSIQKNTFAIARAKQIDKPKKD